MFINRKNEPDDWEARKKKEHSNGVSAVNMAIGIALTASLILAVIVVSWVSLQKHADKLVQGSLGWIVIGLGLAEPETVEAAEITVEDGIVYADDWDPETALAPTPSEAPTPTPIAGTPAPEPPLPSQPDFGDKNPSDDYLNDPVYNGNANVGGGKNKMTVKEAEVNLLYEEADVIKAKIDLYKAQHPNYVENEEEYEEYGKLVREYGEKVTEILEIDSTNPVSHP